LGRGAAVALGALGVLLWLIALALFGYVFSLAI
jgi:hypothetical protein